jgi:membrane protease YdiL (CAAX protease family)
MTDRDSDRPSRAPSSEPAHPGGVRPMSLMGALFWVIAATFLFVSMISVAAGVRESAPLDPVVGGASQLVGYGLALFAILRFYSPDEGVRRVVAARPTSPALYVLGALIGLALVLPVNDLYELIIRAAPESQADPLPKLLEESSVMRRAMVGVSLAVVAPFAEETIFRGALHSLLQVMARHSSLFGSPRGLIGLPLGAPPDRAAAPRRAGAVETVVVTTILFALIHIEWQRMLPILGMGVVFGVMRHHAASILPGVLAHMAFNGVAFAFLLLGVEAGPPPWVSIASGVLGVALLVVFVLVAKRSPAAHRAREAEL